MNWLRNLGPGLLVTAAFIGPGTITTASIAGASFGFALLWAVVFSVVATIVLQEMAARLGVVSRAGLGEALRSTFRHPGLRVSAVLLVIAAITVGNAAFQAGNLTGTAMGLTVLTGVPRPVWVVGAGVLAFALLGLGRYRLLERILIALVVLMSAVFIATGALIRPAPGDLLLGLLTPDIPAGAMLTVIALIGTTVVPYNLFLHASLVQEKWPLSVPTGQALRSARLDTVVSISFGGLITLAIVVTSAGAFYREGVAVDSAAQMAQQLEPLLGPWAMYCFAIGLAAAGFTSAITAPLAAAYATAGALGWPKDLRDGRFRAVWTGVLLVGLVSALLGQSPVAVIVFAQAANGILLPIVAVFLLVVMNRSDLLGAHKNGVAANLLGVAVVLVTAGLGVFQILKVLKLVG